MQTSVQNFPFSAVVGQETFKLALILVAIHPKIGGVLVSGARGSAKTTLSRGFADLLPDHSHFITLPLGCSEEMLIGTLDLQQALNDKKICFTEGLLAKAHQGVLYVDEVNLLADNLVDLLLDVAASKQNIIERDGISHSHDSDFLLIGTMNPDEGELRPQLQDRFALCVELSEQYNIQERVEIVKQRDAFDRNPVAFLAEYQQQQIELSVKIQKAQQQLNNIQCSDNLRLLIAKKCSAANVDGMRADIVWYRAAVAHAAWCERLEVTEIDILAVEELVLSHRRRELPDSPKQPPSSPPPFSRPPESKPQQQNQQGDWGAMSPEFQQTEMTETMPMMVGNVLHSNAETTPAGKKKGYSRGGAHRGKKHSQRINWFETLSHNIKSHHWQWRFQRLQTGQAVLHLILLDTSASVLTKHAFAKAKGVIFNIAHQAYLAREQLVILGFGNQKVEQLLSKRRAPKQLKRWLDTISASGGTPLQDVLIKAQALIQRLNKQEPDLTIKTYVLTDACVTQLPQVKLNSDCVVIDTEQAMVKRGRGHALAQQLGAKYIAL